VLLLDANSADHEATSDLVRDALDGRCQIDCVSDARLGLELVGQDIHDLYLIGLGRSVADTLDLIRAGADCRGPIIALAESSDNEADLAALDAGASECIARPKLSRSVLGRSIRHALVRQHKSREGKQQRVLLDREKDRLNALRAVSHRLVQRASHDIRSPLTVIKTYSSIVLGELGPNIDVDVARFLHTIMRRVDDLTLMADNILDASQLASDLVGSHREAIHPENLVKELRPGLEQMASISEAQLSISLDQGLPYVFCDRGNIGGVIHNLVAGACKAAGRGAMIELWARYERDARSVRIGITDNRPDASGEGVQEEFDPAYPQPRRGSAESQGEDLALHVVSELVRINLGELSVTPHPGGGSTSAFTLPLVDLDRILSAHLGVLATGRQTVSAVSVALATVTPASSERDLKEIVQFLWSELRACDLVVPVQLGDWALCISCNAEDFVTIVRRVVRSFEENNRTRSDSPLPALSLRTIGSWPLSTPSRRVAAVVRRALSAGSDFRREPGLLGESLDVTPIVGAEAEWPHPSYSEGVS
jgi:signal transduction histidine kinase